MWVKWRHVHAQRIVLWHEAKPVSADPVDPACSPAFTRPMDRGFIQWKLLKKLDSY